MTPPFSKSLNLFILAHLPLSIDRRLYHYWRWGAIACKWSLARRLTDDYIFLGALDNSIKIINMFVSIFLLTLLSIDRYISIVWQTLQKVADEPSFRSRMTSYVSVILAWSFAILSSRPVIHSARFRVMIF